ncbi:MAG: methyltransferase domain-containing protein, partial [Planctomycetes bacterium]|nr:methyltransferase domain-containing protein [Planctomycetota bacterium]
MPQWNKFTERHLSRLTSSLKRKRVEQFVRMLGLGPTDVILDLGSEDGSYLASYYPYPHNIVLADISEERLKRGVAQYGLRDYVLLNADGPIPVRDECFDAIWCNSVIEHVTVDRNELSSVTGRQFRRRADDHQRRFASEIERVARKYF